MISIGELDKKTTHSSHHISTPPSFHISFLNLFQAPSGPFQPTAWSFIPTTGMDRSIMSQDAVPKLPSPEILNKKLGFSKCHEFTGHIGGRSYGHDGHMASCGLRCTTEDQKVYRTCCFYFPFQIQPSHLKGTWWEIPMSKIPVTTTMTKGLQITADFCECTRQDYAQFQHVQSNKHHRNFSGQNAGGDGHQVQMVDQCHLINPVKAPKHEAGDLHHQRSASPDWDG